MRARLLVVWLLVCGIAVVGCTSKDSSYCDESTSCASADQVCDVATKTCVPAPQQDGGHADAPAVDAAGDAAGADAAGSDVRQADAGPDDAGGGDAAAGDDAGATDGGADVGCQSPQRACGSACYDLDDPLHCGAACTACTVPTNGQATCDGTACDFTCNGSYWKDGSGCSACTTTAHCGASCAPCTPPQNGQATCDGTACGFTCDTGYWHNVSTCDPCDTASHCGPSCVACTGSTPDCQGGRTGTCVCNSTSCDGTTPICDASSGVCRACVEHAECASGVCGDSGACVATTDIIYLRPTSCSDSGSGTAGTPFCSLPPALAAAKTGPRYHIKALAGTYHLSTTPDVDSYRVVIVGAGPTLTRFAQDSSGIPILRVSHTGTLAVSGVGLVGATGAGGNGLNCDNASGTGPTAAVDGCDISNNGGSGFWLSSCHFTLTRSTVDSNGARGILTSSSTIVMRRSKVTRNPAGGLDLVAGSYDIENCLFAKNGVSGATGIPGGVKLVSSTGGSRFANNTIADNVGHSSLAGAGVICTGTYSDQLTNCIIYGNTPTQQSGCTVTYSDVEGGGTANGNIAASPLFTNASVMDYHLSVLPTPSPCINAGDPGVNVTVDLDGYPRSGNPDMGCYEAH